MITHSLKITSVKTDTVDGRVDVVTTVAWELIATNDGATKSQSGVALLKAPGADFTPFDSLTESQVLAWVEDECPMDVHKRSLEQQFNSAAVEPTTEVTKPVPWAQTLGA